MRQGIVDAELHHEYRSWRDAPNAALGYDRILVTEKNWWEGGPTSLHLDRCSTSPANLRG